MSDASQCKNCNKSLDTFFDYCPHCGQKKADTLTLGILFRNTISNYFSIDALFFKSFIPLMIKPGLLARSFVDGKRLTYLHPAKFYIFISVVFFFIFSFTIRKADNKVSKALEKEFEQEISLDSLSAQINTADAEATKEIAIENQVLNVVSDQEIEAIDSITTTDAQNTETSLDFQKDKLDSLIAIGATQADKLKAMGKDEASGAFVTKIYTQLLKLYEKRGGGILQTLYDTIPIAMFFMLPLFAMLLKIFYWDRGKFAHHLVFSFYFFTFLFTTFCVLILANTFLNIPIWVDMLVFMSFLIYLILALNRFYKDTWFVTFIKASTISFLYMSIILPLAMMGVIFVSFMLY